MELSRTEIALFRSWKYRKFSTKPFDAENISNHFQASFDTKSTLYAVLNYPSIFKACGCGGLSNDSAPDRHEKFGCEAKYLSPSVHMSSSKRSSDFYESVKELEML